jgi:hypothetical protein
MELVKLFDEQVNRYYPNGLDWSLVGIMTKRQEVYTLSYDSKILSKIFEILCEPLISNMAEGLGIIMEKSNQTVYPEFTLYSANEPNLKVAIDVKSTYRDFNQNGTVKPFSFTLGSYRSFLRDGRKSIKYRYNEYLEHWVIGFVYTRNMDCVNVEIKRIIDAGELPTPYTNIEYFVQEKHRIAGRVPGSGNTTNIGSIRSNNLADFREGRGGFGTVREFEEFWRAY